MALYRAVSFIFIGLQLCQLIISFMQDRHPSQRLHKQPDVMSLEEKQKHLIKNKSPRRVKGQAQDFQGYIDQWEGDESSSSELGSLDDSTQNSEGELFKEEVSDTNLASQALDFTIKVRKQSVRHDENIILLYVIKLSTLKPQHASERIVPFEYFKMRLDCTKCSTESDNNEDLRKFRRRVKRKLGLNDNFKIFNHLGHLINEDELSYLNPGGNKHAVVHVSSSGHFDYDLYMKLFHEIKKLGEGGFGQVFLGQHIITKEQYAIKAIYPTVFKADEVFKAYKEAQVLQNLKHPNVIKLFNVIQLSDSRLVLFMDHLTGGSLKEHLDSVGGRLHEKEAQSALYEIGTALNYCHQRNIVHRDIKLENIMLRGKGDLSSGLVIIDFGIAGKIQKSNEQHHEGTIRYVPPELITGQSYKADQTFDIWSLGILLYRMVYGCFPFDGVTMNDIRQSITANKMKEPDSSCDVSDTCYALIRLMLNKDPTKRPKLNQLIQHEWFTKSKIYQQQQLMQQTVYQQSTLMGFFKEELRHIEHSKEQKQQEERKSVKIMVTDQELSSLTREPSYLRGLSHLMMPNSREQRNLQVVEAKSTKKYINLSPSPVLARGKQTFKFQAESGDYQGQVVQTRKLPKEESISSLNLKKQQLSEMRNFIESTVHGSKKNFKVNPLDPGSKPELNARKRRNMNANSLMEAKSINQNEEEFSRGIILPKPQSLSRMVINQTPSKLPSQFDAQNSSYKKQDPIFLRFQNDLKKTKLTGIIENRDRFQQMDGSFEVPKFSSPLRANSGLFFGFQATFEPQQEKRNKVKQTSSYLKSLNTSSNNGKVGSSMQQYGDQIIQNNEGNQHVNPLIVKQHEYKKFVNKAPSQLHHEEPLRMGNHHSNISVLSYRDQWQGLNKISQQPSTVKSRMGGVVLPLAGEKRQIM